MYDVWVSATADGCAEEVVKAKVVIAPKPEYPDDSFVWTGGENGDWKTAGNWSGNVYPNPNTKSPQNPVVLQNGSLIDGYPNSGETRFTCDVYLCPGFGWRRFGSYLFFNGATLYLYGGSLTNSFSNQQFVWSQASQHRLSMHGGEFVNLAGHYLTTALKLYGGETLKGGYVEMNSEIVIDGGVEFEGSILKSEITLSANVGVTLRHGRIVSTSKTQTGFKSIGSGASINFPTGSSGSLSLPNCTKGTSDAFAAIGAYLRIDGAAVDETTFAEKFAVTASSDSADGTGGIEIRLKRPAPDALVPLAEVYSGVYDIKSHHAVRAYLGYPLGRAYTVEYKLGDGEWTREVPVVRNVGEYTVTTRTVTDDGAFGAVELTCTSVITPRPLPDFATIGEIQPQIATGEELKPTPTVTDPDAGALVAGLDFDYVYENNVEAGVGRVTAVMKGNYSGSISTTFEIVDQAGYLRSRLKGEPQIYVDDGSGEFPAAPFAFLGDDDDVSLTYSASEDGPFTDDPPVFAEAGKHFAYCKVTKGGMSATNRTSVTVLSVEDTDAKVYFWTGAASDGLYATPGNWKVDGATAAKAPDPKYDVVVIQKGAVSINVDQPMFLKGLYIAAGADVTFAGRWLHVQGGATLHVWGGSFSTVGKSFVWGQAGDRGWTYPADWCFIDMRGGVFTADSFWEPDPFFLPDHSRLEGGTISFKDTGKVIPFMGVSDLRGATLDFYGLSGEANARLNLESGKLICRSSLTLGNGSALDFRPYSLAELSLPFVKYDKRVVYSTYFETGKILYNGETVDEKRFNELFVMTASPDSENGGSGILLKLDASGFSEIMTQVVGYEGEYDGVSHPAVEHHVTYPADNTVLFRVDDGDWSITPPAVRDPGRYVITAKTIDNRGWCEDKVDTVEAVITQRSLPDHTTMSMVTKCGVTGSEVCPKPVVTDEKLGVLVEDRDYKLTYANNVQMGTATCYVDGCGNFSGQVSVNFLIISREQVLDDGLTITCTDYTESGHNWWPKPTYSGEGEDEVTFTYSLSPDGPFTDEPPLVSGIGSHTCYIRVNRNGVYAQRAVTMTRHPMPTITESGPTNCWLGGDGEIGEDRKWSLGHKPKWGEEVVVFVNGNIVDGTFRLQSMTKTYIGYGAKITTTGYAWIDNGTLHLCGGEVSFGQFVFNQLNPEVRGTFELLDGTLTIGSNYYSFNTELVCLDPGTTMVGGVFDTTGEPSCTIHSPNVVRGTTIVANKLIASGGAIQVRRGKLVAKEKLVSQNGGSFDLTGAKAVISLPNAKLTAEQVYSTYFATGNVTVRGKTLTEGEFAKRVIVKASPDSAGGDPGVAFSMAPDGLLLLVK